MSRVNRNPGPKAHPLLVLGLALALALSSAGGRAAALPATPASAASAVVPAHDSALGVVTSGPVEIGAPDSPRASLARYFDAARADRWDEAARYLVLDAQQRPRAQELARRLKAVIDDTGWIDLDTVSDAPGGHLNDGLTHTLEEVARFTLGGHGETLRMVRRTDAQGAYWAFSQATVARIDTWYGHLPDRRLRDLLVGTGLQAMLRPGPLELLWWQWCGMGLLALLAWILGGLLSRVTHGLLQVLVARPLGVTPGTGLQGLRRPLTLAWALALLGMGQQHLLLLTPAERVVQGLLSAGLVFALFWALWHVAGLATQLLAERPWSREHASARTLLVVGGNLARGAIFVAGVLAILSSLGYPIGTLLAGLGIGGLALALGAQKTLENLFGTLAIAIDQPYRVGDLVTVEGVTGVVEDIGLRSTRLRTLDRTVVNIPNGHLANQRSESLSARDSQRFKVRLGLTYDTTRQQLLRVMDDIRRHLLEHPLRAAGSEPVVRFSALGDNALEIDVWTWFAVQGPGEFAACREQTLLLIMQAVEEAGAAFAFPTRTVHVVGAEAAAPQAAAAAAVDAAPQPAAAPSRAA